jgi:hypothetical protein
MDADLVPTPIVFQGSQDLLVHEWRFERLRSLGVPELLAESFADAVDWHVIANLVSRGCPPFLALRIAW